MSELSNILENTDFENISVEELVRLEDSLQRFANTSEKDILRELKQKIEEQYGKREARSEVHQIRTGYAEEAWGNGIGNISREDLQKLNKRQKKGWDPNNGWKFHLDVVPNRNHPVTKAVSEFLLDININHKIAAGGVNGKGMTVYVGSYDDINKLAKVIQERFGKDIYEPPAYTAQAEEEYAFQPTVYGRFVPGRNGDYPWGFKGIGLVYDKYQVNFNKSLKKAIELGVTEKEHSLFFENDYFDNMEEGASADGFFLRSYCCHKLYAEALGDYYCGSDIEAFEKKFFGDELPPKGTEKRRKWDEVAKTFVEEAKTLTLKYCGKNVFDFIKSFTNGYEPLDLSRIQAEHTSAQSKPVAENNIPRPEPKPEQKPKQEAKPRQKPKQEAKPRQEAKPEPKPEQKPKQETKPEPKPEQKPKQEAKPEPKPEQKPKPELTPDISVVDDPTALPVNSADNNHDKEFAKPYRKFYQGVAKLEKAEYIEDETSPNYNATLVRQNGEEVNIIATRENRISLRGKDKEKNYKIPDYKDFNYLAMLAKKTGKKISFGNIKSPDFKAKLLLACLENDVMMTNVPKFSEMENVDQDIMQRIKDKLKEASDKKNATQQSQQTSAATPKKEMSDSVKRMFNNKQKRTV